MLVFQGGCDAIDTVWTFIEDKTPLFDIPVIGNILAAVLDFWYGLFGCW